MGRPDAKTHPLPGPVFKVHPQLSQAVYDALHSRHLGRADADHHSPRLRAGRYHIIFFFFQILFTDFLKCFLKAVSSRTLIDSAAIKHVVQKVKPAVALPDLRAPLQKFPEAVLLHALVVLTHRFLKTA